MLMMQDAAKFVAKNLFKIYIFLSFRLFKSSDNSNKKQMRKYNPLSLSGVCWDKGHLLNVLNKTFMLLITSKFASLIFRLISYKDMQSGSLQGFSCGTQTKHALIVLVFLSF